MVIAEGLRRRREGPSTQRGAALWGSCNRHAHSHLHLSKHVCPAQALEEALAAYRIRHEQCTTGSDLPGKFVVTLIAEDHFGLGNQLPSLITGALDACRLPSMHAVHHPVSCAMGEPLHACPPCVHTAAPAVARAGFLLALLTERCFFIHYGLYARSFAPELDFSWATHAERLRSFGHDTAVTPPLELGTVTAAEASPWLMQDQAKLYEAHHGIAIQDDADYTAALLQANPHHAEYLRRLFPTGEMFHALAPFLLQVGASKGNLNQPQAGVKLCEGRVPYTRRNCTTCRQRCTECWDGSLQATMICGALSR